MAGEVTGIDHPASVPVGTLVTLTAQVAVGPPGVSTIKWTYQEPSRPPIALDTATGASALYLAPAKLSGQTVKISAKNRGTPAVAVDIALTARTTNLPTGPVTCKLVEGWNKSLMYHQVSINRGEPFFVGRRMYWSYVNPTTKKKTVFRGLKLDVRDAIFFFKPADYPQHRNWADVIACSTEVEGSGAFEAVNTHDQTNFTFGLIQFAAHTYNADFHAYLRAAFLAHTVQASRYFPELRLHTNRKDFEGLDPSTGTWVALTDKDDLKNLALRRFIKPKDSEVTASELSFAGRMVHWTRAEPGMRTLMVDRAVERAKADCRLFAGDLDGKGISVCAAVFDTRLQGRGGGEAAVGKIRKALRSNKPLEQVLAIHNKKEKKRVSDLTKAIDKRFAGSTLKYDAATGEFR
jgi:hypothetical protein